MKARTLTELDRLIKQWSTNGLFSMLYEAAILLSLWTRVSP